MLKLSQGRIRKENAINRQYIVWKKKEVNYKFFVFFQLKFKMEKEVTNQLYDFF